MKTSLDRLVFVYGTLRRGESNHHWLSNAEFVGSGVTVDRMILVNLGAYPAVVRDANHTNSAFIQGEVYRVTTTTFARLDILEDYPKLYGREIVPITLDNDSALSAWIYFLAKDNWNRDHAIPSGDWRDR
jgi:gamma-glutamylcyclotransferase (GGCT)/AIG2-like uncharacterized protein YtfP